MPAAVWAPWTRVSLNVCGNASLSRRLAIILLVLPLAGCNLGSKTPELGPAPLPGAFSEQTRTYLTRPDDRDVQWWRAFGDRTLDGLLETGQAENLDIRQAKARLDAAEAAITVAGAGGFPSLTLGAAHTISRESGPMRRTPGYVHTSLYSLSSNWLIDIFGEVRSQVQSAQAGRDAARASADVARLAVSSAIATSYVDARFHQELRSIAAKTIESRRRTLGLTRLQFNQGIASALDVARAEEAVQAVEAELPFHDANFRRSVHRLSTLVGQPAGSLVPVIESVSGQPYPSWRAQSGVPADLLRNRPDIRQSEFEFISAVADIGFAWSQLFPSISLSGSITPSFVRTSAARGALTSWSFGPTLRLPIFDGGRLRANVSIAVARAEEKQAAWRASVLKAVEEVENALTSYNRETITQNALNVRVASAQRAVNLSGAAYRGGVSSLFELLNAERQLYEAQVSRAQSRRNLALQFIALNIAVGRGLPGPGRVQSPVVIAETVPAAR